MITVSPATTGVACSPMSLDVQIHLLIVVQLQIHHAVLAEAGMGTPVLAFSAIKR